MRTNITPQLELLSRLVPKCRGNLSTDGMVRITCDMERLILRQFNLECAAQIEVPCGGTLVDRLVNPALLKQGEIDLSYDHPHLIVGAEGLNLKLKTLDPQGYMASEMLFDPHEHSLELSESQARALAAKLKWLASCTGPEYAGLGSVFFTPKKLYATDRYVAAICDWDGDFTAFLNPSMVSAVIALLESAPETVKLSASDRTFGVSSGGIDFRCLQMAGESQATVPAATQRLLDGEFPSVIELEASDLIEVCQQAKAVGESATFSIPDTGKLTAHVSSDTADAVIHVPASLIPDAKGPQFKVSVALLLRALQPFKGMVLAVSYKQGETCIRLTSKQTDAEAIVLLQRL